MLLLAWPIYLFTCFLCTLPCGYGRRVQAFEPRQNNSIAKSQKQSKDAVKIDVLEDAVKFDVPEDAVKLHAILHSTSNPAAFSPSLASGIRLSARSRQGIASGQANLPLAQKHIRGGHRPSRTFPGKLLLQESDHPREGLLVSGLSDAEVAAVKQAVEEETGWEWMPEVVSGSSVRVVLFTNVGSENYEDYDGEDEFGDPAEWLINPVFQALDALGSEGVVVSSSNKAPAQDSNATVLAGLIDAAHAAHVASWGLRIPVATGPSTWDVSSAERTQHLLIDGAQVSHGEESWWDTSEVVVYDGVVDEKLRRELLALLGPSDDVDGWDPEKGVDDRAWARGFFADVPDDNRDQVGGLGLRPERLEALCDEQELPPPVLELQSRLKMLLMEANGGSSQDGVAVCRMSEAVYGEAITQLSANAPVASDSEATFGWHVDADPMLAPPSPWTDAYGRYPNRAPGVPRFVTAMVYLSPHWEAAWGAPTRFLDTPTGDVAEVMPAPGRLVLMDQDITHAVTPPELAAGERPRYSLVLKLVIHPSVEPAASVSPRLADLDRWGSPQPIGSAAQTIRIPKGKHRSQQTQEQSVDSVDSMTIA